MTHVDPTASDQPSEGAEPQVDRAATPAEAAEAACYRCGATVPPGTTVCPGCGKDLSRRSVRRRRRTQKITPQAALRGALIGALLALLLTGLAHVIITGLAQQAAPDGTLPSSLGERSHYAWHALRESVTGFTSRLIAVVGYPLLIALGGAVIGVLAYVLPAVIARLRRDGLRHSSHRGRRRRTA